MTARKRGLGRGLDALLEATPRRPQPAPEASEGKGTSVTTLAVDALQANRFQPRQMFDEEELEALAKSIEAQGVIQPIVVSPAEQDGRYDIVAGERRWRAARAAGLTEVPVIVREVEGDRELLELALVENLQRSDLNALEEALAYQSLRERFELSQAAIAERVGKDRSTVTNALRLLKLPPEVQDLIRDGQLSAGQARPLLSLSSASEQKAVALRAVKEGLTARQLEELASSAAEPGPKSTPRSRRTEAVDVHTAAAAETLTQNLQTKVEISRRGDRGVVRIHFHSEEELMRIYEQLVDGGRKK